jgi:hypothetical protein
MATLETQLNALTAGSITLVNGVIAQLTRQAYITPYENILNYQQYVPIVYFNIIEDELSMTDYQPIQFSTSDIYSATDWVVLNEQITP